MSRDYRIIFHIDLNAFYATCAMIEEPYLKNKVFVVGGRNGTVTSGVVSTASYKARSYGIHSGMTLVDAVKLYPKLRIVPVDMHLYQKHSNIFFGFLRTYTKTLLAGSIDEAYMDVTDLCENRHPVDLAKEIQNQLLKEHDLPVSIGIGTTLFLAKMASDMKKPLGITVLGKKNIAEKMWPLSVREIHGIGRKTYPLLEKRNIMTMKDFINPKNKNKILEVMSENSYHDFVLNIKGDSNDIVDPKKYAIPKSVSNETTLSYSVDQLEVLAENLEELTHTTVHRLINEELVAKTVTLKLRFENFKLMTRSHSLDHHTDDFEEIYEVARSLLYEHFNPKKPIRLIGIGLSNVVLKKDLKEDFNLFTYQELTKREEKIYKTIRKINDEFEEEVVTKGVKK